MRILLRVSIPHERFNEAVRKGTAGQTMTRQPFISNAYDSASSKAHISSANRNSPSINASGLSALKAVTAKA